jgi:hypothetical protein
MSNLSNLINKFKNKAGYNTPNGVYINGVELKELSDTLQDLSDSIPDTSTQPKVYRALLTQTGTDAPVATVLENTLGGVPIFSYSDVGSYVMTLTGVFLSGKTFITMGSIDVDNSADTGTLYLARLSNDVLALNSRDSTFTPRNEMFVNTAIQIIVYP